MACSPAAHTVEMVRTRRGFSLIELMAVLSLAVFLAGAGVFLFTDLRKGVADDATLTKLRAVAATQRQLHQQRGSYLTDPAALNAREGSSVYTDGSASSGLISIADSDIGGTPTLFLATPTDDGDCLVLVTDPSGANDRSYHFAPSGGRGCNASSEAGG